MPTQDPPAGATIPGDLQAAWQARGWPRELLQSAVKLRLSRRQIEWWLSQDGDRGLERARWFLWDTQRRALPVPDPPITRPYTDLAYW